MLLPYVVKFLGELIGGFITQYESASVPDTASVAIHGLVASAQVNPVLTNGDQRYAWVTARAAEHPVLATLKTSMLDSLIHLALSYVESKEPKA